MRIVEELVEIWSNEVCDTNQTSTALLTTALIIWLDYYLTGKIPNLDSLLKVTVTPLHVPLTIECSIRFILRRIQVVTKYYPIARSGLEHNT